MLEYDNSAFYYFTLSLISIYLVPVTLVVFQQVQSSCNTTNTAGTGVMASSAAVRVCCSSVM